MDTEGFRQWVCKAIEMEEKGRKFYEQALADCSEGPGREVFTMLRDDEVMHIERIREIEKALDKGDGVEAACTLDEEQQDPRGIFREIAARAEVHKACPSTVKALETGKEFELALVAFYEDALEKARSDLEKKFLKHMVAEEKGHFVLLEDLNFYYQDPEGWAMEQDKAGLDGA
ncbi:MAG: ferritin family protein [Desulfonatronovibrio sp.]